MWLTFVLTVYVILLVMSCESDHMVCVLSLQCHANESILSVRRRVAQKVGVTQEQVQMGISERWVSDVRSLWALSYLLHPLPLSPHQLDAADNNRLIHQLHFKEQQVIIVKTNTYARGNEVRVQITEMTCTPRRTS